MSHMLEETPEVQAHRESHERPRIRPRLRSTQDARDKRRRLLIWGLSVGACVLFVNAIVGENGYLATIRSRHEERALWTAVAKLRLENQRLQQEGVLLRDDPRALEEMARRELGLLGPGETLVIIKDAASAPSSPSPSRSQD